jgi:hypothetical protein
VLPPTPPIFLPSFCSSQWFGWQWPWVLSAWRGTTVQLPLPVLTFPCFLNWVMFVKWLACLCVCPWWGLALFCLSFWWGSWTWNWIIGHFPVLLVACVLGLFVVHWYFDVVLHFKAWVRVLLAGFLDFLINKMLRNSVDFLFFDDAHGFLISCNCYTDLDPRPRIDCPSLSSAAVPSICNWQSLLIIYCVVNYQTIRCSFFVSLSEEIAHANHNKSHLLIIMLHGTVIKDRHTLRIVRMSTGKTAIWKTWIKWNY